MLNMVKIYLGEMSVLDWVLIVVLLAGLIYMCYKNFKGVKQMAINAMREAQIKYLGKTGEERKKKAIEIFKSMPFVKKSLIFKHISAERLYNFFEKLYQAYKGEIKK
jgi:hypothetical protein